MMTNPLHRFALILAVLVCACGNSRPNACRFGNERDYQACEAECFDADHPLASSCFYAGMYWGHGERVEINIGSESQPDHQWVTKPPRSAQRARELWDRGCKLGSTKACSSLETLAPSEPTR
jgi:hypothetical protein